MIQTPSVGCIDGLRLDRFVVGCEYEIGTSVGSLFLTEGWAELVLDRVAVEAMPLSEVTSRTPSNLIRELTPPYYDGPPITVERRRHPRVKYRRR
jgi:hypothetical protein